MRAWREVHGVVFVDERGCAGGDPPGRVSAAGAGHRAGGGASRVPADPGRGPAAHGDPLPEGHAGHEAREAQRVADVVPRDRVRPRRHQGTVDVRPYAGASRTRAPDGRALGHESVCTSGADGVGAPGDRHIPLGGGLQRPRQAVPRAGRQAAADRAGSGDHGARCVCARRQNPDGGAVCCRRRGVRLPGAPQWPALDDGAQAAPCAAVRPPGARGWRQPEVRHGVAGRALGDPGHPSNL